MAVAIAGEHKTVVDVMLEEFESNPLARRASWSVEDTEGLAQKILEFLGGFDANSARLSEKLPEIVIIRVSKFIVYVIPLPERSVLTAIRSLRMMEELLPYLEKILDHGLRPTVIFFSHKGILTLTAYLFLGSLIEKYGVGILFVNGDREEILEIVWSLENKGGFTPEEEDKVEV